MHIEFPSDDDQEELAQAREQVMEYNQRRNASHGKLNEIVTRDQ